MGPKETKATFSQRDVKNKTGGFF